MGRSWSGRFSFFVRGCNNIQVSIIIWRIVCEIAEISIWIWIFLYSKILFFKEWIGSSSVVVNEWISAIGSGRFLVLGITGGLFIFRIQKIFGDSE